MSYLRIQNLKMVTMAMVQGEKLLKSCFHQVREDNNNDLYWTLGLC